MKYKVKVDNKLYEVELNDLHSQPIIALVNGEPVEVWLETEMGVKPYFAQPELAYQIGKESYDTDVSETGTREVQTLKKIENDIQFVTAPIPGVIISIVVKAGDDVEIGQSLCVLEAMKMKNTIRSPRSGKIKAVMVQTSQAVQHKDNLIEFSS
jgi:glutaconyl-CoA/methylmalonyl-CoA decarboxylase subunit gamma